MSEDIYARITDALENMSKSELEIETERSQRRKIQAKVDELQSLVNRSQSLIIDLMERVKAQSELLSQKAEVGNVASEDRKSLSIRTVHNASADYGLSDSTSTFLFRKVFQRQSGEFDIVFKEFDSGISVEFIKSIDPTTEGE